MSVELENQSVTQTVNKTERTWRTTIDTPYDGIYKIKIHREVIVSEDDVFSHKEPAQLEDVTELMNDIIASTETVSYKDKLGVDKTVPMAEIPYLIPAAIEVLVAAKKLLE